MKSKQFIGIILMLATVLTVFFGCKSNESEIIPDTPEITFATEEKDVDEETDGAFSDEEDAQEVIAQTTKKSDNKKEETATADKKDETEKKQDAEKNTSAKNPDNSVETQPKTTADDKETTKKATTTKKTETQTKVTTTKKGETTTKKQTENTTVPTTEFTTQKSTATVKPITAELTYLNDPKNSFIAKLTYKDLEGYSMSEADKSAFLSDRTGWSEYTVRVDFKNNDEAQAATVYMFQIGDNGRKGVFVNGDPRGDMSIAPGKTAYILFNVLVKDGSMMETLVLKEISERELKIKYAATPDNDTDLPNYKYVTVE